ncbi:MAG: hypothetical protein LDL11_01280 [Desulfarculus sp.]|nr:hypothetical protein [Desulfarculus sp.]
MISKKRRILSAMLALTVVACAAPALAADNPFRPKLPFNSAVVKYEHKGSEQGTSVLYLQGDKMARHRDTRLSMMGVNQPKKSIEITTPEKVIEVDLIGKKATAFGNMQTYLAQEYDKLSRAEQATVRKNAEKMGAAMAAQFMGKGGKPEIKEGTYKGKPAQIATVMGVTTYTWKDTPVTLKVEGSVMGMKMDEEAVDIAVNGPVPGDAFTVPGGIPVVFDKEADQMQRQMAANMINMMKDPDFERKMQSQGGPMGAMLGGMMGGEATQDMTPEEREELQKMMKGRGRGGQPGQGMPQDMNMEQLLQQLQGQRGGR